MDSILSVVGQLELDKIKAVGRQMSVPAGERIFSEGDVSDLIYFIESGRVSIFIEKFNSREKIDEMGPGACFGEMAVFDQDIRTASAETLEEASFTVLSKEDFLALMVRESGISTKIRAQLKKRSEELVLKEKLISLSGRNLHVSIKGDPSLRESAMTRERHFSVVDRILPQLLPRLEDMLLNRCVYQIYLGFNNGEVRISTIMDPFSEEFHPAVRLVDESYVERHFPAMGYDQKVAIIRGVYESFRISGHLEELPLHLRKGFEKYYAEWQPISREEMARILIRLPQLREIPSFYVRNVTIGIVKDTIHMQFNCDGAHIVSRSGYHNFLDEYI